MSIYIIRDLIPFAYGRNDKTAVTIEIFLIADIICLWELSDFMSIKDES